MWIKICGITTMRAAVAAAEAGADAVGLVLVPGVRREVCPDRAQQLAMGLPGEVRRVGVIIDRPVADAVHLARYIGLTHVQLHGAEPPEYLAELDLPAIKAVKLAEPADLERLDAYADAKPWGILLEPKVAGQPGGAGVALDWSLAAGARERLRARGYAGRVILAGGLREENVRAAILAVQPDGVDVSSGVETGGEKDISQIYAFVEGARGQA